jgi:hypothetical protein
MCLGAAAFSLALRERLSPDIAISIFLDILEAPVCEVMESVASEHIGRGFHVGVLNRRGAHVRRPGGDEERALAETHPQLLSGELKKRHVVARCVSQGECVYVQGALRVSFNQGARATNGRSVAS